MLCEMKFDCPLVYLNDNYIFSLMHILFLCAVVSIYIYDKGWLRQDKGIVGEVTRGEKSWGYFHATFGFLSVIFLEVISTTESSKGYKTIITLFDLSLLVYLCYFSTWFRNKIVSFVIRSQQMVEK